MRRKKVWRYYCDFCGKGGCSGGAMAKHEKRCTMNPNRECGFYIKDIIQEPPTPINELREIIQSAKLDCQDARASLVEELLDAANRCPACVLAAIRQENAVRSASEQLDLPFNYKQEAERAFADARERESDDV